MSRRQTTYNQATQLEEIKRKALASHEARIQRTLNRLARQEQEASSTTAAVTIRSQVVDPRGTTRITRSDEGESITKFTLVGLFARVRC
jgi:hypothetical protein